MFNFFFAKKSLQEKAYKDDKNIEEQQTLTRFSISMPSNVDKRLSLR